MKNLNEISFASFFFLSRIVCYVAAFEDERWLENFSKFICIQKKRRKSDRHSSNFDVFKRINRSQSLCCSTVYVSLQGKVHQWKMVHRKWKWICSELIQTRRWVDEMLPQIVIRLYRIYLFKLKSITSFTNPHLISSVAVDTSSKIDFNFIRFKSSRMEIEFNESLSKIEIIDEQTSFKIFPGILYEEIEKRRELRNHFFFQWCKPQRKRWQWNIKADIDRVEMITNVCDNNSNGNHIQSTERRKRKEKNKQHGKEWGRNLCHLFCLQCSLK